MQIAGWLLLGIFLLQFSKNKASQCCTNKVADGASYQLVSSTDPAPSFCLGGCIYTKENDPKPGTNYCFREGDGIVSCRGDCGSTQNWIKQFFNEECSAKVNSYLGVNVEEVPILSDAQCGPPPPILGAEISLFDNPICQGMRVQNASTRPSEFGPFPSTADFFLKTENAAPWSVLAVKEGYQTTCQPIGVVKPFIENIKTIYMLRDENNYNDILPYLFLDFQFNISNQLLPDVFIQGNPQTCSRSYQPAPGSPQHPAGKCFPTCKYAAWNTDPRKTFCPCRGMIGLGMKFDQWSLPNQQDPNGKGVMVGSLIAYQEPNKPKYPMNHLWFADFQRRNSESIKVCESNLEVTAYSQFFPAKISKKVPCFPAQIPPTSTNSTVGDNPTTEKLVSMFSEVDGVLMWGGGDRFWLIACQMVEIDFFTALDPKLTPEFCGCIVGDYFPWQSGVATKDQINRCYVQAIQDGPMPMFGPPKQNRFSMWNEYKNFTV